MQHVDSDNYSSDYEAIFQYDFTDIDSSSDTDEILNSDFDEENKLLYLTKMGYSEAEASIAMERCSSDLSIVELTDFICVAQIDKVIDTLLQKQRKLEKKLLNEDDHAVHLPNLMIYFGVPTEPDQITQRTLPEDAIGPPYFYYENVALAPVGVWTEMSLSSKLIEKIRKALEAYGDEPPSSVQKYILDECRKWNLVWVRSNKVVLLESDEVKMLLGFPKNHTRRGGSTRDMFPGCINVMSLFSGIGGTEVVLYRLSILLKENVQELNGDQLEQLMKNDRHGRGSNDVTKLELASRYNQSEGGGLVHSHNTPNETYGSVIGGYAKIHRLVAGESDLYGDAYRPQHEISDNLS
ncbi:DNA (Cytosine-5)-methyltransferase DRM1/2 isoform 4 [Hibiscus syriacus]|uniref:DNA (Cytosine-5)-methyltransferase DRM1/2 isoform 4 n=1 Tax=Hibiscus syriacus TaxID=106335 RepID=A0A6A3BK20_HIBSY|nr:DNA (Cytosine-5)-methyltransferase DRM1/2 isoform 4 [Hibiscus syriacus]